MRHLWMTGLARASRLGNDMALKHQLVVSLIVGLALLVGCSKSGMQVHALSLGFGSRSDATKANREMASETITRFMDTKGWFTADSAKAEYSLVVDISGLNVKAGVDGFERSVKAVWEPKRLNAPRWTCYVAAPFIEPFAGWLQAQLETCGAQWKAQWDVIQAEAGALTTWLSPSSEPYQRLFVLDEIARRRIRELVPDLIRALPKEDVSEVELRMVGVAGELRDPALAQPLIELTRLRDPAFVIQVIYALAQIRSDEAAAFLVTVAGGHASPEVRAAAKRVLQEWQDQN